MEDAGGWRVLNQQFQENPGRVYDVFNGMSKDTGDQASERPKYKTRTDISGENKQVFENIDEASGYWKELWETEGNGDKIRDMAAGGQESNTSLCPSPR